MAEEAALLGLSRTMSMHMEKITNSTVSFREAAAQHNKNISNIVKDVFSALSSQRSELSETNENLEESISGIRQGFRDNARATDALSDSMQQVLSVQYKTLGELSLLNRNMNSLIYNTSGGVLGGIFSNIFGDTWFGRLATTLKDVLPLGAALGAATMAGQGGESITPTTPPNVSKNLAANQQEAYTAAKAEGLSDKAAKILTANMSGESLANPSSHHWDRTHMSQGIVQWDPNRAEQIRQQFGKYPKDMTVAEQTKAAIWEMKTHYKSAWESLSNENLSDEQRMYAIVKHYEKPQYPEKDTATRLGFLKGLKIGGGVTTPTTGGGVTTPTTSAAGTMTPTTPPTSTTNYNTTNISNTENPDPGRQALPPGTPAAIGPMGGYKREEENREHPTQAGAVGASLPKSDIVALGNVLQQQGLRISEHPQFGGVSHVHKGRAHYEGRAIDINVGTGVVEASDPAMASRFDKLADQLTAAGYKVYWRESGKYGAAGHNNHLHAEILPGGKTPEAPPTATTPAGQVTPTTPVTPGLTPQAQAETRETPSITNFQQYAQEQLMQEANIVSGMNIPQLMGGGMMGNIMDMFGSLGSGAEGLQQKTPEISNILQAAAVEEKVTQSMQFKPPEMEQRKTEEYQMQAIDRHYPAGSYSEYNTDNHVYPEWASMLYDVYGKFTGGKSGNIKTSLA